MLCSAAHGVPSANVGCFCPHSDGDIVCSPTIADPVLWNSWISWYDHGPEHYDFPEWCQISCECISAAEAHAEYQGNVTYYDAECENLLDMEGVLPPAPPRNSSTSNNTSNTESNSAGNGNDQSKHSSEKASTDSPADHASGTDTIPAVQHDQCSKSCTTNHDCTSGGNTGCMCSVQFQQYQPGSGTVAFLAACIISLSGKRDESMPCPCNASYVSHSCCGSESGLVWEAENFKLGELLRQATLLE